MRNIKSEYTLTFSRECTPQTLEIWYRAENDLLFKYLNIRLPGESYMFFEYQNNLAKNYIDLEFIKKIVQIAIKRILKNPSYFLKIKKQFWKHHTLAKPYLSN